jgi:uncharacterized secreted protein with C-terminal beta-propeller domain
MAGKFVDKGFYAGEAFVKARVKAAGAFCPIVAIAVCKEAEKAEFFFPVGAIPFYESRSYKIGKDG